MSVEERVRLWNSIVRGRRCDGGEWNSILTEFSRIKSQFALERTTFSRERLMTIRKWLDITRNNYSDEDWRTCVTKWYNDNGVGFNEEQKRDVFMIHRGGECECQKNNGGGGGSSSSSRTVLATSSGSSSSSSGSSWSAGTMWSPSCIQGNPDYIAQLYGDLYRNRNRWDVSMEERVRAWNGIYRGHRCDGGEWDSIRTEFNRVKTQFALERTTFSRERLMTIRKWIDITRNNYSDEDWRTTIVKWYNDNGVSFNDEQKRDVFMIHRGGECECQKKNSSNQSSGTVLVAQKQEERRESSGAVVVKKQEQKQQTVAKQEKVVTRVETVVTKETKVSQTTAASSSSSSQTVLKVSG